MQTYFITGTDTNCGKTYVSTQLLLYWHKKGYKAQAIKPIASGCLLQNGKLINEDIQRLQAHNYHPHKPIHYKCYEEPIAPHIAAQKKGDLILAASLNSFVREETFQDYDILLIEGAGGLLVPLNEQETWLDFLKLSKIPVILIVRMGLGCINHALLTDYVLKANQIPCLGWIANSISPDCAVYDEIIATLITKMHMPLLTKLQYYANIEDLHVVR